MIKNIRYRKEYTRPHNIQRNEWLARLWGHYRIDFYIIPRIKNEADWYLNENRWLYFLRLLRRRLNNERSLEKHLADYERLAKNVLRSTKALKLSLNKSNQEIIKRYNAYFDSLISIADKYFLIPVVIDEYILAEVQKLMAKEYISKQERERVWRIMNLPTSLFNYQKAQIALLRLLIKSELNKRIYAYAKKWGWMAIYDYIREPFDAKYFLGTIKNIQQDQAIQEIKDTLGDIKANKRLVTQCLEKIKNKRLKFLLSVINDYITRRTDRVDVWRQSMEPVREFYIWLLKNINNSKKQKWSLHNVVYLTQDEVIQFLKSHQLPSLSDICIRSQKNTITYFDGRQFQFITAEKEIEKIKALLGDSTISVSQFKGQTAQPGVAKGKVRLVLTTEALSKFKADEILVAPMTRPEFVPAMKKAAAIITDEGGITCHAAIISRELGIPCIIGTKIATKVLKDGDRVEVNASNGIIRKL